MNSIVLLLVAVSGVLAQAKSLVGTERSLAAMLSHNLAPAVDILRCFTVSEYQISEHIRELLTGQTLILISSAKHRFEFKLTDEGLQQRFVSDGLDGWHDVDGAAYRTLLAVAPEKRWQVFEAVQSIIVGTSTMPELVESDTSAQLIIDDVKTAIDKLPQHNNLTITDGIGITGTLANYIKQPKNHAVADSFYQFLLPLISNAKDGLRGEQALTGIDNVVVSIDQRLAIHASKISDGRFVYLAIDSSTQPEQIILGGLHSVPNPHNSSLIGMVRRVANSWHDKHIMQLEHRYPELIETRKTSPDTDIQGAEILLRTFEIVRNIISDPQLKTLEKLSADSAHLSFDALIDRYVDLSAELYALLFNATDHDYAKLITETEDLFEATFDDRIVTLDNYSAMINFLQMQPHLVVNNSIYARDLSHIHYHKTKELLSTRLIDDLTQTAQLLEANAPVLTQNPTVVATLTSMEIGAGDNQALANLLRDWASKFTRVKEQYAALRQQFSNHISNELRRIQPALDALKLKLIAEREGWTVLGNDKKIIVTSQFAKFYRNNKKRIANFDLRQVVRASGSVGNEVLEELRGFSKAHFYSQNISDKAKLKNFLDLLGNPYEIKMVGSPYTEKGGSKLVLNGIEARYEIPEDARPVYQLAYPTYRLYAQVVQLDDRLYLALLSGFHKEEKNKISNFIQWMQKNRQSKAIIDAMNILAKIENSADQQVAEFELEHAARKLYYQQ